MNSSIRKLLVSATSGSSHVGGFSADCVDRICQRSYRGGYAKNFRSATLGRFFSVHRTLLVGLIYVCVCVCASCVECLYSWSHLVWLTPPSRQSAFLPLRSNFCTMDALHVRRAVSWQVVQSGQNTCLLKGGREKECERELGLVHTI